MWIHENCRYGIAPGKQKTSFAAIQDALGRPILGKF